uniref:Putative ixostatin n=1 Tax=Ixodes ricinus TaxID=34613 RepID=A0A0K8R6F3_IXORI
MQLTTFMVLIGLTHLLCEAISDSTWYVDASMNSISGGCKSKLLDEVQDKCLRTSLGSTTCQEGKCVKKCDVDFVS